MKKILQIVALSALFAPFTFASAASVSIQSLSPGDTVMAKNKISFSLVTAGFTAQTYQVQDSFSGTTVSSNNFDNGGNFQWVPLVNDVGVHTLTVTARNFNDESATVTQTITVLPPPSVTIVKLSPPGNVAPGQAATFSINSTGFTSPSYSLSDEFSGSTIGNVSVDLSGNFSWTPDMSQNGKHRISVYATDSLGHSASANVDIQVGAGPRLIVQLTSTSTTISPGNFVSFNVIPVDFAPTGYSLTDSFAGQSTMSNANISSSGQFWWMPSGADAGVHIITIRGQVGAFGDAASTTQTVTVLGPGGAMPNPNANAAATTTGNSLAALQAQLAALNAKIASQVGASVPVMTPLIFQTYLKPGSQGDEVTQLQKILIKEGYLTGEATGYYGNLTVDAVVKLQAANGLSQLGVVGPATRALLNKMLGATAQTTVAVAPPAAAASGFKFEHFMGYGDDTEPDVPELQKRMKALGYLSQSAPLGFYGSATEAAVKKFQNSKGLPAVGYCDKATRAALNSL